METQERRLQRNAIAGVLFLFRTVRERDGDMSRAKRGSPRTTRGIRAVESRERAALKWD